MACKDIDIRKALLNRLRTEHQSETDTVIVGELAVRSGDARVDIAVINGETCGYEIKSDRDTLVRLPKQSEVYEEVFDRMTIVVGSSHTAKAALEVPTWWGIIEARLIDGQITLQVNRMPKRNRRTKATAIVRLLWKSEATAIIDDLGIPRPTCIKRTELWELLVDSLSLKELSRQVREKIKSRGDWRSGTTPFRNGDSMQCTAKSLRSRVKNLDWLLSRRSLSPPN